MFGCVARAPNKDSSFTCITRVNRSLVGRGEAPLPTTKDLVSPGNPVKVAIVEIRMIKEKGLLVGRSEAPLPTNKHLFP